MLFQIANNYQLNRNPQLSRVWIKTGNPKMPLKSVWINDAKRRSFANQVCAADRESESRKLTEDHLAFAACSRWEGARRHGRTPLPCQASKSGARLR